MATETKCSITNPRQRRYIQSASPGLKHCSAAPKTQVCKHILHGTQLTCHRHNVSRRSDRTGCAIVSCLVTSPHRLLVFNPATPLLPLGSSPPRGYTLFAVLPSCNRLFFLWRCLISLQLSNHRLVDLWVHVKIDNDDGGFFVLF